MPWNFIARLAFMLALVIPLTWFLDCDFRYWMSWLPDGVPERCAPLAPFHPLLDWMDRALLPEWYLAPSYAMLRAIDFGIGPINSKLLGVIVAYSAALGPLSLALYSWKTTPARAWLSLALLWPITAGLAWSAWQAPDALTLLIGQLLTLAYFFLFALIFPILARPWRCTGA
jgi:quinol-cytochrome oxidoreductase complex cytochrome b subunit